MTRPLTPEELCSLIDDHFSTLVLFARQWSPNDADDLVQDAFLKLVKQSPSRDNL
jgi:DNA-directed RNA polymerase specialized sigma24 family protein